MLNLGSCVCTLVGRGRMLQNVQKRIVYELNQGFSTCGTCTPRGCEKLIGGTQNKNNTQKNLTEGVQNKIKNTQKKLIFVNLIVK
jgi:hypothetical protein